MDPQMQRHHTKHEGAAKTIYPLKSVSFEDSVEFTECCHCNLFRQVCVQVWLL